MEQLAAAIHDGEHQRRAWTVESKTSPEGPARERSEDARFVFAMPGARFAKQPGLGALAEMQDVIPEAELSQAQRPIDLKSEEELVAQR